MRRLFVAIDLPDPIQQSLAMLQAGVPGTRWVASTNFHLTLRFIGDVPEPAIGDIADLLSRLAAPAFSFNLDGVGSFGSGRSKSVLWVGVQRSEPLRFLRDKVDRAVSAAGFGPDTRKFSPHVTLAYAKQAPKPRIAGWLALHALFRSPPIDVSRFTLMDSQLGSEGAIYTPLANFDLSA